MSVAVFQKKALFTKQAPALLMVWQYVFHNNQVSCHIVLSQQSFHVLPKYTLSPITPSYHPAAVSSQIIHFLKLPFCLSYCIILLESKFQEKKHQACIINVFTSPVCKLDLDLRAFNTYFIFNFLKECTCFSIHDMVTGLGLSSCPM